MQATDILTEEHRIILCVLDALEKVIDGIENGAEWNPELGEKMVRFIKEFADSCHHGKEEAKLFKWMREQHIGYGPVGMLEEEHETGRGFVRGMHSAITGRDDARFCECGRSLIEMLRVHIEREDHGVFVMADDSSRPGDDQHLLADFANVEEEAGGRRHERGYALAQEICDAAGVPCVSLHELPHLTRFYFNVSV